jgi:hypothetical protein
MRVSSVIRTIDEMALTGWPDDDEWQCKLPEWFTAACAPRLTQRQAELWLECWKGLSPDERARTEIENDWSLDDWIYWMKPDNRQWFWWDAALLKEHDHILVAVEVNVWPFPWGSLRWLFRASGASTFEPEQ